MYLNKIDIKKLGILLIVSLITVNFFGCSKPKEGVIAEVNGVDITKEEFNGDYQVYKKIYERLLGEDALQQVGQDGKTLEETLKEDILEKLIMEKLVEKETEGMKITVTDEEIQNKLDDYANQMGGDEKFHEFLLSNNISKDFFKENMRKEILVDKHKENIIKDINISEEDAKKFYEENKDNLILIRASHILVSSEEEGKKILERLKDGEDFATLATLESLDSVSAAQGGDLGYFRKGQMISEFEDAAFSLEIGETSDLIKTEVGYHIIHLEDRKETYEDLKQDIVDMLKEQEYIEKIRELRNKAKVKTI